MPAKGNAKADVLDGEKSSRPNLVRGWSAKCVLPKQSLKKHEKADIINPSDSGLNQLAQDLKTNHRTEMLDLQYQFIGPGFAAILAKGLPENKGLKYLHLPYNELSDDGTVALAAALESQDGLVELNLDSNDIGDIGADGLAKYLKLPTTKLKKLHLNDNRIGKVGVEHMGEALCENKTLETLRLSLNDGGNYGCNAIAEAMKKGCPLSELELGSNGITCDGAEHIGEAIYLRHTLKKLVLRTNRIKDEGLMYLCEAIVGGVPLEVDEKTGKVTKRSEPDAVLKELDLDGNVLKDESTEHIADVLVKNHTLQKVGLKDNFFTDTAGKQFLNNLQRNSDLNIYSFQTDKNEFTELIQYQIDLFMRTHARALKKKARGSADTGRPDRDGSNSRTGSKESRGRKSSRKKPA